MKVLNLSVERGVLMGVDFSPVLHEGMWVGEGYTGDERALARFRLFPDRFILTEGDAPLSRSVNIVPLPQGVVDDALVLEAASGTEKVSSSGVWPEGFPERALKVLSEAGWTLQDVLDASDEQLEAVSGIGPALVKAIKASL